VNQSHRLSAQETKVLLLLGEGKTRAEIAKELRLGNKTVGTYIARCKTKLGAVNINQLIRIAVLWHEGIINLDSVLWRRRKWPA
jgi:DNA-binding CsgD family transcriptional regulator